MGEASAKKKGSRGPVIGVDLGGTKILAEAIAPNNTILSRSRKRTKAVAGDAEAMVERIAACIEGAMAEAKLTSNDVAAIGVGAPGPTDSNAGVVLTMPNLGVHNLPLAKLLGKRFGVPAHIENDVNAGTYAEYLMGAGKGAKNIVGVFPGTGIGGGVIIDGKLVRGKNHTGGEIGHTVVEVNGPLCGCGVRGCVEAYAGRNRIVEAILARVARGEKSIATEYVRENGTNRLRSKALARGVAEGDKVITETLEETAQMLGDCIGSAINLLGPEVIVLGGGVTEALGSWLVERVAKATQRRALALAFEGVKIVEAKLGDDATCLGAAILAREALA